MRSLNNRVSSSNKSGQRGNTITYAEVINNSNVEFNNEFYSQSKDDAALTVIHESLHLYLGFSDQALAKAASMYGKNPSKDKPKEFKYNDEGRSKASKYLQGEIEKYCKPIKLSTGGGTVIR